jgi:thiamine-phosphate pyrophosphorylase
LRPPVLCFVASQAFAPDGDLEKLVTEAVAGGVTMVQLREPGMAAGDLLNLARRLKQITRGKALLVINDRIDIAIAVEADGVQVPEAGLPTLTARGLIGKYAVLGRSVHSVEEAQRASREGAEFVIAGTIYQSPTHPDFAPVGPGLIEEITRDSSFPVLAIGGVTADKVDELVKAGAAGIAIVSAIANASEPKAAAEELMTALREAWSARLSAVTAGAS